MKNLCVKKLEEKLVLEGLNDQQYDTINFSTKRFVYILELNIYKSSFTNKLNLNKRLKYFIASLKILLH